MTQAKINSDTSPERLETNLRFSLKLSSEDGVIKQIFVVYKDKEYPLPESKWLEFSDAAGWTCREYIDDKTTASLLGRLFSRARERHILTSAFYQCRNEVFAVSDFEAIDLFGEAVSDAPSPLRMRP